MKKRDALAVAALIAVLVALEVAESVWLSARRFV